MEKFAKSALMLGALLAGAGVFYHFVIFLPGLEREKQSQIATEKAQRRAAYETCKEIASRVHELNWTAACRNSAQTNKLLFSQCLERQTAAGKPDMGKS
ncbi:hypothetical protein LP416_21870 [Polaromonas sp. P2-4]|nr:hypothetical protein LP416_21870 [Polaromonas sp. P2-4]